MTVRRTSGAGLGTFAGVFTPSILTILGIILFLRLGYVVGNAGLGQALLIIGVATVVSILTSISLAAIATNIEVKGGGDYYLISRTLGVEFGGAIGIVLFLAQSVSVAFYAIGFAEAASDVVGLEQSWVIRAIAAGAVLVLFFFSWAGADVATRLQFIIMGALFLALASFFLGAVGDFDSATASSGFGRPADGDGFWVIFGIFFPAVTGFTQGVSMSGDLRHPTKSLPRGTFAAVGLSTLVYVAAAILLAGTTPQADLINDTGEAMQMVSVVGWLIVVGVVAATLSSAMSSFLGAPRILQSLAVDRIFPMLTPLGEGHGPASNPRRAVLVAFAIALATIGLGSLDVIAPVVSMFFLISYGLINYATFFESRAKSPSFRPRFRFFNKWASLAGALACLGAMLAINPIAAVTAVAILFGIYRYLAARGTPDRWADSSSAHHFQRAKESIAALSADFDHPRNWRPQILTFSADPVRRPGLLRFAKWLEGDSGITSTFRIVQGHGAKARIQLGEEETALQAQLAELGLGVYGRAVLAADALESVPIIVQAAGLGRVKGNTVVFGWPETTDPERYHAYAEVLRDLARLGINVVALYGDTRRWEVFDVGNPRARRIDVLWSDDDTGRLTVLYAYLCTRTPDWAGATIRVVAPCSTDSELNSRAATIAESLDEARISAEVSTVVEPDHDEIVRLTSDAAMVFLGMRIRGSEMLDTQGRPLGPLIKRLPLAAALMAGTPIQLATQPDTGIGAELAEAEEQAEDAKRRLAILEKNLSEADELVEELKGFPGYSPEIHKKLEEAEHVHEVLTRRTLAARARVEAANRRVNRLIEIQRQ